MPRKFHSHDALAFQCIKKDGWWTNNDKPNASYETTGAQRRTVTEEPLRDDHLNKKKKKKKKKKGGGVGGLNFTKTYLFNYINILKISPPKTDFG